MSESKNLFLQIRNLLDTEGIGPSKLLQLVSAYNSIDGVYNSSFNDLLNVDGISEHLANKILMRIDSLNRNASNYKLEFDKLKEKNFDWIHYWDENYPENLKNIYSPPIILYYSGKITREDRNSIAVVGTRNATRYGKSQAEKFSKHLVENKITVISGLARGIDSISHRSALDNGGRTIAVIGSGLDVIYPPENRKLFADIENSGAIITEYPLGTKPDAQNFPKRNRIISGLSLGTLVIETKESGGALQTARFALDQNKEVFAIPGSIDSPQSGGTNLLIQNGEAKLVRTCDDILVELELKIKPNVGVNIPKPLPDLNMFEQKIYEILTNEPKHIDTISSESNINSSECLVHLLSMEFQDLVKQLPGKTFLKS